MATLVGRSLGRYRITEFLGEGGMGVVYKARDTRLDRDVAIKVIREAAATDTARIERFKREARAVAQLSHPNILEIHDFGDDDGVIYAVMELLEGTNLRQRLIGARGRLTIREASKITAQAAAGLEAAHSRGVIHRDVKPENIFLTHDGRLKILDFGLAHLKTQPSHDPSRSNTTVSLTDAGTVLGTLRYMSPEQVRGQTAGPSSDLFSLGCVTYEMITGKHPFLRTTKADTISAILHDDPESMIALRPAVSPALNEVVLRCLEKKSQDRFHSAHDLGCSIQAIGETSTLSGRIFRRRLVLTSKRMAAAAIGGALVVAALFGYRQMREFFEPPAELPERIHLGVARFATSGGAEDLQPVADGIAVNIVRRIVSLESRSDGRFWVVEPELVFADNPATCTSIRKMFNTTVCLQGSYDVHSDLVSLTLEVIDATSGEQIAVDSIKTPASNIAFLQTEPAIVAARLLGLVSNSEGHDHLKRVPTNVSAAFTANVRAHGLLIAGSDSKSTIEATALLEEAVAADPLYDEAWIALGQACLRRFHETGDPSWLRHGIESIGRSVEMRPTASGKRVLASLHAANKDGAAEIAALEGAISLDPTAAVSYQMFAGSLRREDRFPEAINALQRAINLRPGYWIYEHDLASLHYARGEYDSAANHWRRVTQCAPFYDGGYANLGIANFLLGNSALAKRNFERAIELNPDSNANTYLNLGSLYFADAQFADAATMFEKAIKLNADTYITWGNLAFSLADGLQPERAKPAFERAVELAEEQLSKRPDDAELLGDLAGYHAALKHEARARECLELAIALHPTDPEVLATIGESFEDIGDRERALEWVAHAFDAGAPPTRFETRPTLRSLINDPRYRALRTGTNQRVGSISTS